jgi:hypothetical protein
MAVMLGCELFGRLADLLAKPRQRLSQAVRMEVWQARTPECLAKCLADRLSASPVFPFQSSNIKLASGSECNTRGRE